MGINCHMSAINGLRHILAHHQMHWKFTSIPCCLMLAGIIASHAICVAIRRQSTSSPKPSVASAVPSRTLSNTSAGVSDVGSQALVLIQLGELHTAAQLLAQSEAVSNTNDATAQVAAAILCLGAGRFRHAYEFAITAMHKVDEPLPAFIAALAALGHGSYDVAARLFQHVMGLRPNWALPQLLYQLCITTPATMGATYDISIPHNGVADKCDREVAWFLMAFAHAASGKMNEAMTSLQKLEACQRNWCKCRPNGTSCTLIQLSLLPTADGSYQLVLLTPRANEIPPAMLNQILAQRIASMPLPSTLGSAVGTAPQPSIRRRGIMRLTMRKQTPRAPMDANATSVQTVRGKFRVRVDTSHIPEATAVAFYVDYQQRYICRQPPFVWEWDTTKETPGMHTLVTIVLRADGSVCAASSQKVSIELPSESTQSKRIMIRRAGHRKIDNRSREATSETTFTESALHRRAPLQTGMNERAPLPFLSLISVDHKAVAILSACVYQSTGNFHGAFHAYVPLYREHPEDVNARAMLTQFRHAMALPVIKMSTVVRHINTTKPVVALTFDDGPRPYFTERILDILRQYNTRATFFVVGKMVERYPELLRAIVNAGHEVGNHSYTHNTFRTMDALSMDDELLRADIAIANTAGVHPVLFRPPGGGANPELMMILARQGYTCVLWECNIGDYIGSPERIALAMVERIQPGTIVLMHNGKDMSLYVLPHFLKRLQAKGFSAAPVGELLGIGTLRCNR